MSKKVHRIVVGACYENKEILEIEYPPKDKVFPSAHIRRNSIILKVRCTRCGNTYYTHYNSYMSTLHCTRRRGGCRECANHRKDLNGHIFRGHKKVLKDLGDWLVVECLNCKTIYKVRRGSVSLNNKFCIHCAAHPSDPNRSRIIFELRESGFSYQKIGTLYSISRQRVLQLYLKHIKFLEEQDALLVEITNKEKALSQETPRKTEACLAQA